MDKGEVIREVCKALLKGDKERCAEISREKYPFAKQVADKRKYTFLQMSRIFLRDGFIDRYSGEKLLFPGIFRVLKLELPEVFPAHTSWKMAETHMVYWELFPTIDHIYPIARGGVDKEENWLTTSMVRNSAKSNWTLEEIGWTIKEPGKLEVWDGLSSLFLDLVDKTPELCTDPYIKKWKAALVKALED